MPNILLINSSPEKNCLLTHAFKELRQKDFSFSLWSSKAPLAEQFRQKNWPVKKIYLGPDLGSKINTLLFVMALPFLQFKFLLALFGWKFKNSADIIACLNLNEKIIITLPARFLGFKVVWLECPEINYRGLNYFLAALYRLNSKFSKIITFSNFSKQQLKNLGCDENKIELASPGARQALFQENIFNKLATANQANYHRKYFSVGAITALNQKQKIETIFQAIKISLTLVPNIQLIIIGDGEDRKSLLWLAKKMGIENLVWLVGEQEQLKKWLDSFDIFLATGDTLSLDNYANIIEAMAAGLPVLAPRNIGLEDVVLENKTGALLEADNSEMLARQIIKLHQDKKLRHYLGQNGRERAKQLFTMEKMVEKMESIINYK